MNDRHGDLYTGREEEIRERFKSTLAPRKLEIEHILTLLDETRDRVDVADATAAELRRILKKTREAALAAGCGPGAAPYSAIEILADQRDQARRIAVHLENEVARLTDEVANLRREHVAVRGLLDHVNQQAAGALTLAREERALRLDPRSFDSPAQRTAARMYNTNTENEAT